MKRPVDPNARNHCVYFHRIQGRGVFYIGMGLPNRPLDRRDRSKAWNEIVRLNPNYEVHILETDLTIAEAAQLEIDSIAFVGLENLVNKSKGGTRGMWGVRHTDESRRKMRLNSSNHRPEIRAKHSFNNSGEKNGMHNDLLFVFFHDHFGYVICTQHELRKRFELLRSAVSQIVNGRRRSARGWRVVSFV